jgi:hypothetical protein
MARFTKFFSTDNPKSAKGYDLGWLNAINYMAPDRTGLDVGTLCPDSSAGCRSLCLGMYSGQAAIVTDLENGINAVRKSRIAKAQWFISDTQAFMAEVVQHIFAMKRKAKREGKALVVRMNGSTDVAWERIRTDNGEPLPQRFAGTQFVDYTKSIRRVLDRKRAANYHLTFSLSETNKAKAEQALAAGHNVAVVFGHGQPETFMGHRVIDGTKHDLRQLDPAPVIVGLDPKGSKAKNDASGFVVRGY